MAGCAQHPVAKDAKPYRLDVGDDVVTISIADEHGIPVEEFIRVGHRVTGKVFTYSRTEVANAKHGIRLRGKVVVKREKFFAFFETMLYVNGFACVPRGKGGAETVEIKAMRDGRHNVVDVIVEPVILEHAACEELEPLLHDLLNSGVRRQTARIEITAVPRTNTLLLSGGRKLVAQLDQPIK